MTKYALYNINQELSKLETEVRKVQTAYNRVIKEAEELIVVPTNNTVVSLDVRAMDHQTCTIQLQNPRGPLKMSLEMTQRGESDITCRVARDPKYLEDDSMSLKFFNRRGFKIYPKQLYDVRFATQPASLKD